MGLPATLVVGELDSRRHVWVTFVEKGALLVLETTRKGDPMVSPARDAVRYEPAYGVDTGLQTYVYESGSRTGDRLGEG